MHACTYYICMFVFLCKSRLSCTLCFIRQDKRKAGVQVNSIQKGSLSNVDSQSIWTQLIKDFQTTPIVILFFYIFRMRARRRSRLSSFLYNKHNLHINMDGQSEISLFSIFILVVDGVIGDGGGGGGETHHRQKQAQLMLQIFHFCLLLASITEQALRSNNRT